MTKETVKDLKYNISGAIDSLDDSIEEECNDHVNGELNEIIMKLENLKGYLRSYKEEPDSLSEKSEEEDEKEEGEETENPNDFKDPERDTQ